ncbi:hypothetical protein [Dyadobacter arcticus]|uniref:Uncharacterized protein n=1 Tax=Dyadobacter arcticus TaxID=1078754 RepID=A0ABX0UHG6_9BACT|nr:hypothetical protein [Dyadobacter arcticus]NIJ52406.1 hypothetical protein [Dyadobacter arcticus]
MINSRAIKWLPGLLFLAAQLLNTIYEVTQDTRTLSWAPHTTQVHYKIQAFENGRIWNKQQVEARYGIAQKAWEAHAEGNLIRIIRSSEEHHSMHPDSVQLIYSRNGSPSRTYLWTATSE